MKLTRMTYLLILMLCFCLSNSNGQTFFSEAEEISVSDANGPTSVFVADVDGDGDNDLITATFWNKKISWNEYLDGIGAFGEERIISKSDTLIRLTSSSNGVVFIYADDLDSDGDNDIISFFGSENKICWYENLNNSDFFGTEQIITSDILDVVSIYVADLDGDNDIDVLSASKRDNTVAWYENTDGKGSFGEMKIISNTITGVESIHAADLDGDNDNDVLMASGDDNSLFWCKNLDGEGNFGRRKSISHSLQKPKSIHTADFDTDGDLDVLVASFWDDKISWFENTNGKGSFGYQQVVTDHADGATFAYPVDIDGDEDTDIVSSSQLDNKVAWYENTNGKGSFGIQQVISENVNKAQFAYGADLNSDGRNDIVAAGCNNNKISWFENIPIQLEISDEDTILIVDENCQAVIPDYSSHVNIPDHFQEHLEISQIPAAGNTVYSERKEKVTLTFNRTNGNSVELTFNVWIIDKSPPVVSSVHPDQQLIADDNCQAFIPNYASTVTADDNCSYFSNLKIKQTPEPWSSVTGNRNEVIISVTDDAQNGNTITFNVSVSDQKEPSLACSKDKSVTLNKDEDKYLVSDSEFDPVISYDNCSIVSLTNSFNNEGTLKGARIPVGKTVITWKVVDASGNSVQCSSAITVNEYTGFKNSEYSLPCIYPSYTKGIIYVSTGSEKLKHLHIIDIKGRVLFSTGSLIDEALDISHFPDGIYFYLITTSKCVYTGKLLKEN